jgi:hypothetical protein
MTGTASRRRGHGEDAIYFDAAKNRYVGAISVGFGPDGKRVRRTVTGRTKAEVRDKLKAAHAELDRGLHTSATYTVQQAVSDWLEGGLPGPVRSHAVHLPGGAEAAPGAHRDQAAQGADGPRCAQRA